MRLRLLVAAAWTLAACRANVHCTSDTQCERPEEACRPAVNPCFGYSDVVTLARGYCRDRGATCSGDLDCVPTETCQMGTCAADPALCITPPSSCPTGCDVAAPFPCACVCQACPAPP